MQHKGDNHRKSGQIKITHYVSPHKFWFKYVDNDNESAEKEIQERIERLGNVSQKFNHSPSIGEVVIVRYGNGTADKLIRARVDHEFKYTARSEFVLWAIDEGFPILSNKKWIAKLTSTDLQNVKSLVFKATLNDVVPATVQYNFLEFRREKVKTNCWSEKAINEFEKISNAESLIFHLDRPAGQPDHLYGSVQVITYSGQSAQMNDVLKQLDEAVDATDFESEYKNLIHKDYWLQQQENYKIRENFKFCSISQQEVKPLKPTNIRELNTVDKINDWDKRNQRSMSTQNAEAGSTCTNVRDYNLNKVPLNKRYGQSLSEQSASQPSTKSSSRTKTLSNDSSEDSFHSAAVSSTQEMSASTIQRARQQESLFSIESRQRLFMKYTNGIPSRSINTIADANFTTGIKDNLVSNGKITPCRTQAVGWPHLMRSHSLIVVNAARSGKTWTYLPAVCSLLEESHNDERIVKCDGPVMIIICLDSSSVSTIRNECCKLLSNKFKCEAYVQHGTEDIEVKMLNGIDILITTIPCLLRLTNNPLKLFHKNRMMAIVFDEIDSMYDRFGKKDVDTICREFCEEPKMQDKCYKEEEKMQVIVTSKTWQKALKKFCRKSDALLLIGSIEAAIYSKAKINVISTDESDHYGRFISHFKAGNYTNEPTIIICSESDEVVTIVRILRSEGYATGVTHCHNRTDTDIIKNINKQIEDLGILVCTDEVFADLDVRNKQHIIHFSLPGNWTIFNQRFRASYDYYLKFSEDRSSVGQPTSLVFVNANSNDTMPRLIEFMRLRCFADVPEEILKLAERKLIEREENRQTACRPFCENILSFGTCHSPYMCESRHVLLEKFDRPHASIPRDGFIQFEILSTYSPAQFRVRLLKRCTLEERNWEYMPDYLTVQRELNDYFKDEDNCQRHFPFKVGDLCAIKDSDNDLHSRVHRCKIIDIKVDERKMKKTIKLLFIDSNDDEQSVGPEDLLDLPDRFHKYPPQAVDIRIAGVVPLDFGTDWDKSLKDSMKGWLKKDETCHIEGKILLSLQNCIWVENVQVIRKLPSIYEETVEVDVKREIVRRNLAVTDANVMQMLQDIVEKTKILHTEPNVPRSNSQQLNSPQPIVHLPLAKVQERGRGRGRVLSLSSSESVLSRSNVMTDTSLNSSQSRSEYSTPDKICTPKERWATLVPNSFNEIDIGEFYSPDRFYVLLASQFNSFGSLRQKIENFAKESSNLKPLVNAEVGQICLANTENGDCYRRAKILEIERATANIFLVDYGEEEWSVPIADLIEIPDKLVKSLPFQAIFCQMVGIRPTNESEEWPDNACAEIYRILADSKVLHVRPTGKHSVTDDIIKCHAYSAVYIDKELQRNINRLVVDEELADFDPQTKHFVDLTVDWNTIPMEQDEEDWYSDDEGVGIYDAGNYLNRPPEKHNSGLTDLDFDDKEWDLQMTEDFAKSFLELNIPGSVEEAQMVPTAAVPNGIPKESAAICQQSIGTKDEVVEVNKTQLGLPAKMPRVVWQQTATTVTLTISAPDVKDYSLKVASRYVHFCFMESGERFENILNLFGCVDAKFTSHEVRGLNIIVRLNKTLAGIHWPRLVQSTDKNQFIKYKMDQLEIDDMEIDGNEHVRMTQKNTHPTYSSEEGEDSDASDLEALE